MALLEVLPPEEAKAMLLEVKRAAANAANLLDTLNKVAVQIQVSIADLRTKLER